MKKSLRVFLAAGLALALPACALAVTEGVVEDAPAVAMESGHSPAEISYLPDDSYSRDYGSWMAAWENAAEQAESVFDGDMYHDVEQRPRLTAGEAARARALLAKVQAGEIAYTGESVLEKLENVVTGVYALNPAEFDGETVFTILPGPWLSDEQLLSIIDAFAQLGLVFDPDALNYRNCARGGGIETTRFFTDEERTRYDDLAEMIRHGRLDAAGTGALVRYPRLDSAYFCGLDGFSIKPYRSMTDEELVSLLVATGVRDESGVMDFDAVERDARALLNQRMACPLSMRLSGVSSDGSYLPRLFAPDGENDYEEEGRRMYGAFFSYEDGQGIRVYAQVMYDWETKQMVEASVMHAREWEEGSEPFDGDASETTHEEIAAALKEAEAIYGLENATWHLLKDGTFTNWGPCHTARAQLEEDLWLTAYVGKDDNRLHGMELSRGALVDELPEEPGKNG